MRLNTPSFAYIAFLSTLLVAACSGSQSDITTEETATPSSTTQPGSGTCMPTAASVQGDVFKASCDGAGCHGSQNPAAGLNLVDSSLDKLMGTSSALCTGWSLIVPGSPEKSFLYQKLTASMPACGEAMPLGKHLSDASAQCVADWIKGMGAAGGCETCGGKDCVALASDTSNCGACDNACPAGVACENGTCSCPTGAKSCSGSCVDVSKDVQNCGGCGNTCSAGSSCEDGQCTCPSSFKSCGGTCADLQSDPKNCGACGAACSANQVCLTGKCAAGCGSLAQCGGSCVDTQTSVLSCGGCDKACAAELTCAGGKCGCATGELCGTSCVDTRTDAANCGQCGVTCGAGEACVGGACQCSASGTVSFKGDVAPVLASACTAAGCHAGMKPKEGLALEATKSYAELVNVTASQCGGKRKLVAPGSPSSSYLLQKLLNVDICTGTQMPKAGQSLPQKQIDTISSWICSGAPNN